MLWYELYNGLLLLASDMWACGRHVLFRLFCYSDIHRITPGVDIMYFKPGDCFVCHLCLRKGLSLSVALSSKSCVDLGS